MPAQRSSTAILYNTIARPPSFSMKPSIANQGFNTTCFIKFPVNSYNNKEHPLQYTMYAIIEEAEESSVEQHCPTAHSLAQHV